MKLPGRFFLLSVLIIFILFRLFTMQMIDTYTDTHDYWQYGKSLASGHRPPEINHHISRFTLIGASMLINSLPGESPYKFYILPMLLSFLSVYLIFKLLLILHGYGAAVFGSLVFTFFPEIISASCQFRPDIFTISALLGAVYIILIPGKKLLFQYRDEILISVFLFLAWGSNETAVFVFPGILFLYLYSRKNRRGFFIICGFALFLFFTECAVYKYNMNTFQGRFELMRIHNFADVKTILPSFFDLFKRYAPYNMGWSWALLIYSSFLLSVPFIIRSKGIVRITGICGLSFYILILFAVKSVSPLVPALTFLSRYLMPGFGLLIISFTLVFFSALTILRKPMLQIFFSVLFITGAGTLTAVKYISPMDKSHPIIATSRLHILFNEAVQSDTPVFFLGNHPHAHPNYVPIHRHVYALNGTMLKNFKTRVQTKSLLTTFWVPYQNHSLLVIGAENRVDAIKARIQTLKEDDAVIVCSFKDYVSIYQNEPVRFSDFLSSLK